MTTNEFIKDVKIMGFYAEISETKIKITRSQTNPTSFAHVSTKHRNVFTTDYFPFVDLPNDKQEMLVVVLNNYSNTPIDER